MVFTRTSLGVTLGLLAICLQVAVTAMGGRLCCYQTQPVSQQDSCCAENCCDAYMDADTDGRTTPSTPICPGDSDCCVEQSSEVFAQSNIHSQIRDLDLVAPVLAAAVVNHSAPSNQCLFTAPVERVAHPPPSLLVVRTTVLLI